MEPFSIATGIIGVLAAIDQAQKCVRKIRTMRNAHTEIIQLAEDVSDLHETLVHVSSFVDRGMSLQQQQEKKKTAAPILQPESLRTLEHLGNKAASRLEKLLVLIPDTALESPSQPPSPSSPSEGQGRLSPLTKIRSLKDEHWQWTRNRNQAQSLQQELRGIQLNVLINLSVISSSAGLQSWSRPENTAIVYGIEREVIHKDTVIAISPEKSTTSSSPPPTYEHTIGLGIEHSDDLKTSRAMTRRIPQVGAGVDGNRDLALTKRGRKSTSSKHTCEDWCSCQCHKRTSVRLNSSRGAVYGSLYLSSNGMVFGLTACDEQQCRRNARRSFKLIYRPPKWLCASQLQLSFLSDPLYGPELRVRLPRTVAWESPLWGHAIHGNTLAIRDMFDKGEASPHDVNALGGSILHYAADRCYFDLCRLLIERGATPFLVDDLGGNPTWKAWEHSLCGKLSEDEEIFVRDSFEGEEYLESREFTVLHKIVLGLTKLDLNSMLQISTADIDSTDAEGKTCLAWAALRADAAAVESLLAFGADPEVTDAQRRTPLHHVRTAECCNLLLKHGANIWAKDEGGRTPLHWACRATPGNADVVRSLLAAGLDPSLRDNTGETALINAVYNNSEDCVLALVEGTMDPTNNGVDLIKCFLDSLTMRHYGVLSVLQRHCARFETLAKVLPADLEETLPGSEIEARLDEHFKTNHMYLSHLGGSHVVDNHLKGKAKDFLQAFGLGDASERLDVSLADLLAEKLDVFVDAVEVLPDDDDLVAVH